MTTWDEYGRRRAAIASVLEFADAHPDAGLPFEQLPEVAAVFGSRRELLLALQHEWSQALWARIELLSLTIGECDAGDVAQQAWLQCAAQHSALRRLLDARRDELGPSCFRAAELRYAQSVA